MAEAGNDEEKLWIHAACDLVIAQVYLSGKAREIFMSGMDMDEDTWLRARAFGLCQIEDKNSLEAGLQRIIISSILHDNR